MENVRTSEIRLIHVLYIIYINLFKSVFHGLGAVSVYLYLN